MTPEQKEIDRNFQGALIVFRAQLDWLRNPKTDDTPEVSAADLFENALENVLDVYNDWREHLGEPVRLAPSALARELRLLADKIERE